MTESILPPGKEQGGSDARLIVTDARRSVAAKSARRFAVAIPTKFGP